MAQDKPFSTKIIPKYILWVRGLVPFWVLRHSFLLLTDCQGLYNIQLKTSSGVLFLPPSDAYVKSFLYLLYTLIKPYDTKSLSDQASSLAPDWILLLRRPRIPASFHSATTFQNQRYTDFTSQELCFFLKKKKNLRQLKQKLQYPTWCSVYNEKLSRTTILRTRNVKEP